MRSKADETLVIVETLICPLQIFHTCIVFHHSSLSLAHSHLNLTGNLAGKEVPVLFSKPAVPN